MDTNAVYFFTIATVSANACDSKNDFTDLRIVAIYADLE